MVDRWPMSDWSPASWETRPIGQEVRYDDPAEVRTVIGKLRALPPLVTSWEVESLKSLIADGKNYMNTGWWISIFPGLAIVATGLGFSLLGDGLADLLRPQR